MSWPLSQDYNEAIQDPRNSFSDAELKTAEAVSNAMGIPMPRSGNFADVYEMRSRSGGHWAVKCFTREVPRLRERYAAISRHLKDANLPFIVDFTFLEQGIRVAGGWYPILKMQWVEGLTLNEFVRQYVDKPAMLQNLLQIWMRMAVRLREAGIAHADLQHGNVLLVPASTGNALAVKLVDYDGMWVPALAGGNSGEVGHPCYQHPQRLAEGTYSLEVDRFPLLMVATALDGLRVGGRALWDRYDSGDNLLFREADLQAPVKSRLFYELLKIGDPRATRLASQTLDALKVRLEAVPLLEELLPELYTPSAPRPAAPVTPKRTTIQVTAADLAAAIQPGVEAPPTRSVWKFGGKDKTSSRRRRKGGLLRRVGCVAGVAVAGLIVAGVVVGLGLRYEAKSPKDEVKSVEIESENPPSDTRESTKPPEPKKLNLPRLPWLADKQKPDRPEEQVPPLAAGKAPADKQKTNKPKEQGFVTLFNGKNLDGWKTHPKQPGNWRVVEGTNGKVLTGSGALASYLYSERGDYKDFRLRVEARINEGGIGGVYIRAPFGPQIPAYDPMYPHGYEALINSGESEFNKTGTLYMSDDKKRFSIREAPVPHNQWFRMEVIAQGDRIIVKVNDTTTADYQDPKRRFSSGHLALEQLSTSTEVEFRTIKIEELPAQVASPKPQINLSADSSVAELRQALKNDDSSIQEKAAALLAKLGPKAEPALDDLAEVLTNPKNATKVRRNSALAIAHIGTAAKSAAPALAKTLKISEPLEVRQYSAEALSKIRYPANEAALPAIVDAIENDTDPSVRQKCIWSLFGMTSADKLRECGADKVLTKMLDERGENLRLARYDAARKLAQVLRKEAPDKTAEVLLHMLQDKQVPVYKDTDANVTDTGSETQANASGDARYMAAEAIGWLDPNAVRNPDAVKALREAAADPDAKLSTQAQKILTDLNIAIKEPPAKTTASEPAKPAMPATATKSEPSRPKAKDTVAFDDKGRPIAYDEKGRIIKGRPIVVSQPPLDRKTAAVKAYNKSCADARTSLLKAFNLALDQLAKGKGSTEARLIFIAVVKEEKERFESRGLIPWSEPMRIYVERYLGLLGTAQARLSRAYESLIDAQLRAKNDSKVADLRAELKNRLDIRAIARWRQFVNGRGSGIFTLYSNGRMFNPEAKATWSYDARGKLIYRYAPNPQAPNGGFIDTLNVSADGTTYTGTNNDRPERRPKVSGNYVR